MKKMILKSMDQTARRSRAAMVAKTGLLVVALQLSCAPFQGQVFASATVEPNFASAPNQAWAAFQGEIDKAKKNMMADPATALDCARKAQELTEAFGPSTLKQEGIATSLWLQSEALIRVNRASEVQPLLGRALEIIDKTGSETKLTGDLHLVLARVSRQAGAFDKALENLHLAHDTFARLGEARSQAIVLLGIGSIYNDALSYDMALEYFVRADEVYSGDTSLVLSATNNAANALKGVGQFDAALAKFYGALEISREMKSPLLQGRILTNIASVQILTGDLDGAEASADLALTLFDRIDAQEWAKFAWGIKAEVALSKQQNANALDFINRTFAGSNTALTKAPFREMHEIATRVFFENGLDQQSARHDQAFRRLEAKCQEVANMALAWKSDL